MSNASYLQIANDLISLGNQHSAHSDEIAVQMMGSGVFPMDLDEIRTKALAVQTGLDEVRGQRNLVAQLRKNNPSPELEERWSDAVSAWTTAANKWSTTAATFGIANAISA